MKTQPQVSSSASRAPAAPEQASEQLVHALRNILAGMTYGMQALDDACSRGDEQAIWDLQRAMARQVDLLRDAVAEATRLAQALGPQAGS
jgi:hypothetical protein